MHTRYGRVHNSAQPDGWLLLIYLRDAFVTREYRSYVRQARRSFSYGVKYQTLRSNYRDQIAQFVFDVAGHSDGMGDFLAQ